MKQLAAYTIEGLNEIDTPFLAVYTDVVERNIQTLMGLFTDKGQIRPHVKTHKCPEVVKLLLNAGITKFKCATIAEAEMLALAGAVDVLMAYQPTGPKIGRFLNLINTYPSCAFSCLVDNEFSAQQISDAAVALGLRVSVWVDLNVGMNRTGVLPAGEGKKLFQFCSHLRGIVVAGLHAYDGHLTGPDANVRLAQAEAGFADVKNLANDLVLAGFKAPRIVAGSTPTIQFYARQANVECSPGTFIYWDQYYRHLYPELGFENAALVITRVISKPGPDSICLDLGYKAISSEGNENERVDLPELPDAKVVSQSEEHLLIESVMPELRIGEAVYGVPYHIGRTCNLYEECVVIQNHQAKARWPHTGRCRRITL